MIATASLFLMLVLQAKAPSPPIPEPSRQAAVERRRSWPPQPPDDGRSDWVTFVVVKAAQDCATLKASTLPPAGKEPVWTGTLHLDHITCFPHGSVDSSQILTAIQELSPDFVLTRSGDGADLWVIPTVGGKHGGAHVAVELVRAGLAMAASDAPESFLEAEKDARKARRGAWGASDLPPNP